MILLHSSRKNACSNWKKFAWRTFQIGIFVSLALRQYKLEKSARNQFDQRTKQTEAYFAPTQNSNRSSSTANAQQEYSHSQQALDEWRKARIPLVEQLIMERLKNEPKQIPLPDKVEDMIGEGGPILDFLIAGFPKCGTTGMMRTLHSVTVMPANKDVCVPMKQTVWKTYVEWPEMFGSGRFEYSAEKPLKGSKCPQWIRGNYLTEIGRSIPKTPLIVGIRHPVLFFQSFSNQVNQSKTI